MDSGAEQIRKYNQRLSALKNERTSWMAHWKDLSDYILPRSSRLLGSAAERNKGDKRNSHIINNTATRAVRVLSSGMMAGITSPARPWFKLGTPDPQMSEYGPVRVWLHQVEDILRTLLARSNTYNALHNVYTMLACFGTAPLHVEEDSEDVLRAYVLPIGQYCLANSSRLAVDTVYRELSMTVAQLVERFGLKACSQRVRDAYDRGNYDTWIDVIHIIEPNREYERGRFGYRGKPYKSCWHEAHGHDDKFLKVSGFTEGPIVPRWNVTGEDVYGSSPAMDALGDIKALQLLEKRKMQAVEKILNPPMKGPQSLLNQRVSLIAGDFNPVVENTGQTLAPAMEVPPPTIQVAEESIQKHVDRINGAFFADLWLMMAQTDRRQMTATEVAERHEEKMLQLGPVLERLEDELLDPLIDRVFAIALRAGHIPPPPQELQGQELRVEYISILAQAQKLLGTASVERLAGFVGNLAAVNPGVLDKVNMDAMVSEYSEMLGTNPNLLHPDEQVQQARQARAQQQQALMAQQQMAGMVQGAKTLSETDMEGDTALNRLMGTLGGMASGMAGTGTTPRGRA
jgi:hypothetical protein